ncbi:MAG: neutral/alkaline non-lysosomal ceramidase N-terminal domain-containing protein, partial [Alphaproteobacteria bacterium]
VYFWSLKNCRWSDGVHDPIYATAMVFLKGDDALMLIQTDLVQLLKSDIDLIRQAVAVKLAVDRERVIVTATHSHASPDTVGLWGTVIPANPGRDGRYMNEVIEKCVDAAVQAYQARRPARLYLALGEETKLHYNIHQERTADPNLDPIITLIKVVGEDGQTFATLTNWACHPTTASAENRKISSDWVGAFYRTMAEKSPGVHMFINGSIGGSVQPSPAWRDAHAGGEEEGFVWAEAFGTTFGEKVAAMLDKTEPIDFERIEVRNAPVEIKIKSFIFRLAKALNLFDLGESESGMYTTEIAAVKMGSLRFGTMPGEMSPHLGKQIREQLGGEAQILVGLGQDSLGYILDEEQYEDDEYNYESMLCVNPLLGRRTVEAHQSIGFD